MNRSLASWLIPIFLLFGVVAPTGCVLWFMNAAARSQGAAARQSVTDAWRGQLRLLRDRADSFWLDRAAALDSADSEALAFQRIVSEGLADSAVMPNYPFPAREPRSDSSVNFEWRNAAELERQRTGLVDAAKQYALLAESEGNLDLAARAAQAQIRCLVRSGNKEAALGAIQRHFIVGRLQRSARPQERSIRADELLLFIQLLKPDDPRRPSAVSRLAYLLNDYSGPVMPSAQRLFLAAAIPSFPPLPTGEAERLAQSFLDANKAPTATHAIESSNLPGVWKISSRNGRLIALYRTATVPNAVASADRNSSRNVKFDVLPPGEKGGPEAIAAGQALPGWQLSFSLTDSRLLDEAEHGRIASYLWIGYVATTFLIVTGLLLGQWLRREVRVARLKTDLVAAVSHEIRTPLGSMRLLTDTLLDDENPDPVKVREYLTLIGIENQRLSRLIDNFLTFSRIERNRQQFVFAHTPVSAVIEKAIAAMGERLQTPDCELECDVSSQVAPVSADEDALVTVMTNLLDNACKYTRSPRKISISACVVDGKVILSVKDNGIGIAPREHRKIFRRFYQVDQRLARETGGCGLGLSIVNFIVRAHGGRIRVDSRPDVGSTFSVILPKAL